MGNQNLRNRNLKYGNELTEMVIGLLIALMPFVFLQWQAKVTWKSHLFKGLGHIKKIILSRLEQRQFLSGRYLPSLEEIKVPKLHVPNKRLRNQKV